MEENKVATKLGKLIQDFVGSYTGTCNRCKKHECSHCESGGMCEDVTRGCDRLTDAILQSPDLRVTLVEPRYYVEEKANEGWPLRIFDRKQGWLFCRFSDEQKAHEYCAWLNSKEPK